GLLEASLGALLPAEEYRGPVRGTGSGLPVLRWRAAGAALRSAQECDPRGPAHGRRRAPEERGVPPLCRSLGLPGPSLPAVPGPDQGEGGAARELSPWQFRLWPGVR